MAGGVFISYRREDSGGFAGRVYDRLVNRLGHDNVFFDVDTIPPGRDFVEVLSDRVGKCDALIAVIGRHWVDSVDAANRRRLDDPNDFVRIEIEAALARDVPVIPVLVDGATMPHADDLPEGLKKLPRRQGIEISLNRFDSDAERLTDALAKIEAGQAGANLKSDTRVATPLATAAPKPLSGGARWLLPAAAALVVIVGAGGFLAMQRPPPQSATASVQLHTTPDTPASPSPAPAAAPNSAALSPGKTSSVIANLDLADIAPGKTLNAAPAPNAEAAPPAKVADAAPAKMEAPLSKLADAAPAKMAAASPGTAPDEPPQWMSRADFAAELQKQSTAGNYPDKAWGRCQNGEPQAAAHWSPRPPGQHFAFWGANDDGFKSHNADLTAKGYTLQYDNVFQDCNGAQRHQALWMKAG